jgi:hypothetical protein
MHPICLPVNPFTRLIDEALTPEAAAFWRAVQAQALFGEAL